MFVGGRGGGGGGVPINAFELICAGPGEISLLNNTSDAAARLNSRINSHEIKAFKAS